MITVDGSSETITININGSNDGPVITPDPQIGYVTEDFITYASGQVIANDVDASDTLTYSAAYDSSSQSFNSKQGYDALINTTTQQYFTAYGSFSLNSQNGEWLYNLNNDSTNVQALADGQTTVDSLLVVVSDNEGATASQTISITINGTNDGPVAVDDTFTVGATLLTFDDVEAYGPFVYQGFVFSGNAGGYNSFFNANSYYYGTNESGAAYTYSDNYNYTGGAIQRVDGADFIVLSVDAASAWYGNSPVSFLGYNNGVLVASLAATVDPHHWYNNNLQYGGPNGHITFGPEFSQIDQLLVIPSYDYIYIDNLSIGSFATENVATENFTTDINVLGNDTDVDAGAVLSVLALDLTSSMGAALSLNTDGTVHYSSLGVAAIDALGEGETITDTFTYSITDERGATDTATVSVRLTGQNDGPLAVADTNAGNALVESGINPDNTPFTGNATAEGNVLTNDIDVDFGALLTVSAVNGSANYVGSSITGTFGSVIINSNGSYIYTLDNTDADTNALAQNASASEVFSYTVSDEHGATSTTTLTINITGSNDGPIADPGPNLDVFEDDAVSSGLLTAKDLDASDVLTYRLEGDEVSGLTVNADGAWIFDPSSADYQKLSAGVINQISVNYVVVDSSGSSDAAQLNIVVTGINDHVQLVASDNIGNVQVTTALVSESYPNAQGLVLFTDPDALDSHAAVVTSGPQNAFGQFTLGAIGSPFENIAGQLSWSYQADPQKLESLAAGVEIVEVYTVEISDQNASNVLQTVTITLKGANQAPQLTVINNLSQLAYSDEFPVNSLSFSVYEPDAQSVTPAFKLERLDGSNWINVGEFEDLGLNNTWTFNGGSPIAAGQGSPTTFAYTTSGGGLHKWTLQGYNYLPAGTYRYSGDFSDGAASVSSEPVRFEVKPETLTAQWAATPIVNTSSSNSDGTANVVLPINILIKENDLSPGALDQIIGDGLFNSGDLKIQVFDQSTGKVLATTHPTNATGSAAPLTITKSVGPGGTVLQASANVSEVLKVGEQVRHYQLRTVVSGQYYNYLESADNTTVSLSRNAGALVSSTDSLTTSNGYAISGLAAYVNSTQVGNTSGRLFSVELTGQLPKINNIPTLLPGNFLLTASNIASIKSSNVDTNADKIIDYRSIVISGSANLYNTTRAVDPVTGEQTGNVPSSSQPIASGIRYSLRFKDYDVPASEPVSGIYNGYESMNGVGVRGMLKDEVDFVAYQPNNNTVLFSTNGFDPIKDSINSPLNPLAPLYTYQPNILA